MNKRVLISLSVIALLLLYLLFSGGKRSNVPEVEKWEVQADEISITGKDDVIKIIHKDGKWLINEKEYPADKDKVQKLVDKMKDLELSDLITEKQLYKMYDLTSDKSLRITVKSKNQVLRDIQIGKKSSTNRQTYIKFFDKPEIYLASGAFRNDFEKSVDDLRDKVIFKVSKDSIDVLKLTYMGRTLTFTKVKEEAKEEKKKEEDKEKPQKKKKTEKWICREYSALKLDSNKITPIVNSFNSVSADSFPEIDKKTLKFPVCSVAVNAFGRDIVLNVYNKEAKSANDKNKGGQERYICSSSESPFAFTMNKWKVEKYFKSIGDFTQKK